MKQGTIELVFVEDNNQIALYQINIYVDEVVVAC
jgi:hypothetical protein